MGVRGVRVLGVAAACGALMSVGVVAAGGSAGSVTGPSAVKVLFKSTPTGDTATDEIWAMNPNGTSPARLAHSVGDDEEPRGAPDGSSIIFTRNSADGTSSQIFKMNVDGSSQVALTTLTANVQDENPSWSHDAQHILYTHTDPAQNDQVWEMNANGSNQHVLFSSSLENGSEAVFSPDGTKIVFQYGEGYLWVMNANGSNPHVFLAQDGTHTDENPSWSPDGSTVAFTSDRSGADQVWAVDASGANPRSLTPGAQGEHPSYSPDGTKIAFASDRTESDEIWVMNPDGSSLLQLTSTTPNNGQPDWLAAIPPPTTTTTTTTAAAQPAAATAATPAFTG